MATIKTKYSIGETVFLASTHIQRKQHKCPDCKGTRKWTATSPAGQEYAIPCPRCTTSYRSKGELSLDYSASVPTTRKLTIGSIKTDTHGRAWGTEEPVSYMCSETGIGSGNVWRESVLFSTEEDALKAAQAMADKQNDETPWLAALFNKTFEISDYELESAALKEAAVFRSRAASLLWNINDLFHAIDGAGDLDAVGEAVAEYKSFWLEPDLAKAHAAIALAKGEAK